MEEATERDICELLNVATVEEARDLLERGRIFATKTDVGIVQRLLRQHLESADPQSFGTRLAAKLLERIDQYLG